MRDIQYCPKCDTFTIDSERMVNMKLDVGDQVTYTLCRQCRPQPVPLVVQVEIWKTAHMAIHGSFISAFAMAMIHADESNQRILEPASLMLIEKYDLLKPMAASLTA